MSPAKAAAPKAKAGPAAAGTPSAKKATAKAPAGKAPTEAPPADPPPADPPAAAPPVQGRAPGKKAFDRALVHALKRMENAARRDPPRHCTVCGYQGRFVPFGNPPRPHARCLSCGTLERHRLFHLWLMRSGGIGAGQSLLHFAPEPAIRAMVEPLVGRYVTADYLRKDVDLNLDIQAIDLADASFDRIICNHVLEHVDDRRALAELFRILVPGGVALLSTPICEGWAETYENPEVRPGPQAAAHFGQWDHVRFYGRDVRDRIRAAGFLLDEFVAVEPDVLRYGLWRGETLFIATRPAAGAAADHEAGIAMPSLRRR